MAIPLNIEDDIWANCKNKEQTLGISYVSFGGGGAKGMAYIGIIRALREEGLLESVKAWAGSSIGSIAALLATSGADDEYIERKFMKLRSDEIIKKSLQKKWYSSFQYTGHLMSLIKKYGLDSGNKIQTFLETILEELGFCKSISLREYYEKTGKILVITAASINTKNGETLYLTPFLYPDFSLVQAIRISTCIPVIFTPQEIPDSCVYHGNRFLVDGGLYDNCPISVFDLYDTNGQLLAINRRSIAFILISRDMNVENYSKISDVQSFLKILFESTVYKINKLLAGQEYFWPRAIPIECNNTSSFDHKISTKDRKRLAKIGYLSTKKYIKERKERNKEESGFPKELFLSSYKYQVAGIKFPDAKIKESFLYSINPEITANNILKY